MLFDENTDPLKLKNLVNDPKLADVTAEFSKLAKQLAAMK